MASDQELNIKRGLAKKSSSISQEMASFVDRLSQPKHRHSHHSEDRKDIHKLSTKGTEGSEMDFPGLKVQIASRLSTESLDKSNTSSSHPEFRAEGSATNVGQLNVPRLPHKLKPSSSGTNLSRELAASVERLSRPKSRKKSMHKDRLSLNLDEQWKSLEEACQPSLQQTLSPTEHDTSTLSSSRDSICSVSTNASFGSRSSLLGSHGFNHGGKLCGSDHFGRFKIKGRDAESNSGRRKARSERLLASMDSLHFSINDKGLAGSKSLSPNDPSGVAMSKWHTLSVERLPSVGSRLMLPTVSSTLKHRVASETKLSQAPKGSSLSSKGVREDNKYQKSQSQRLNVKKKSDDDIVGSKIKSLAGELLGCLNSLLKENK